MAILTELLDFDRDFGTGLCRTSGAQIRALYSETARSVGLGSKLFEQFSGQSPFNFTIGERVVIQTEDPSVIMRGLVTSIDEPFYNSVTINVTSFTGSGFFEKWVVSRVVPRIQVSRETINYNKPGNNEVIGILLEKEAINLYPFFNNGGVYTDNELTVGVVFESLIASEVYTVSFDSESNVTLVNGSEILTSLGDGTGIRKSITFTAQTASATLKILEQDLNPLGVENTDNSYIESIQLERGSFKTSNIETYTFSYKRGLEKLKLKQDFFDIIYKKEQGTFKILFSVNNPGPNVVLRLDDTTNNNYLELTDTFFKVVNSGVEVVSVPVTINRNNSINQVLVRISENNFALKLNRSAIIKDMSALIPNFTRMFIGSSETASLNGNLRTFEYFPRALEDMEIDNSIITDYLLSNEPADFLLIDNLGSRLIAR